MSWVKRKKCTRYAVSVAVVFIFMAVLNYLMAFSDILSKSVVHFKLGGSIFLSASSDSNSTKRPAVSKSRKWTLVDIRKHFNNSFSGSEFQHLQPAGLHRILWFNMPPWMESHDFMSLCDYNNCEVTQDRNLIRNVSAVLFCVIHPGMGYTPPLGQRDPNQVWVFYGLEAPFNYHYSEYESQHWRNMLNWSMTYRSDSDVQEPYGVLQTLGKPKEKDYDKIFRGKTKMVIWVVSHCITHSKREDYVREMQKYISVDVFGMCGTKFTQELADLVKDYKFFLSFENSLCPDYVTEKFFKYFSYDLIQVVRGGVDYDKLLPNDTFINTAKFPDAKTVAQHLIDVGSDPTRFTHYLRRKDMYDAYTENFTYKNSMCELCRKLNHKQLYRNSYADIHEYVQKTRQCIQPYNISDIRRSDNATYKSRI